MADFFSFSSISVEADRIIAKDETGKRIIKALAVLGEKADVESLEKVAKAVAKNPKIIKTALKFL
jgi:hypothetical protein